jgi:transcriptional regulator with XRE-family HTH domain
VVPHVERDIYAQSFKRARLEAARRLSRPDFEERAEAARAIGISESMLKQLETGTRRPGFETLEDMARAYSCLPGDLLPSLAPKGPEVDRILGPVMTMPQASRSLFLTQLESLAKVVAASIAMARDEMRAEVAENAGNETSKVSPTYQNNNQSKSVQPDNTSAYPPSLRNTDEAPTEVARGTKPTSQYQIRGGRKP